MRNVHRAAERIFKGVNQRYRAIRKGKAGGRSGESHSVASGFVGSVFYHSNQMLADEPNGLFRQAFTNWIATFIGDRCAVGRFELIEVDRGVSFDRMGKGVDAAVGGHLPGTAVGEGWIDYGQCRPEEVAERADFDLVGRVGQHGSVRNFAASAGCCRHADQWYHWPRHIVEAEIFSWMAAVSQ